MKKLIVCVLCIFIASLAFSQGAGRRQPTLSERIGALEKQFQNLNENLGKQIQDLNQRVEVLELKLQVKSGIQHSGKINSSFKLPLEISQAAYVDGKYTLENEEHGAGSRLFVYQIIDPNNMLAELRVDYRQGNSGPFSTSEKLVWIEGYNTKGLVDGQMIKTELPFKITGTKQYDNNTVFLLKPIMNK